MPLGRTSILLAIILTSLCCSGCSVVRTELVNDGFWSDYLVSVRNRAFSAKAWIRRKHHFGNQRFSKDFRAGFRQGYEDVAAGKDGCCPATPPSSYWSWEFQSREGQQRTEAWFAGYPHGARAAEEDGVSNWNQMPLSVGLEAEYDQAGMPITEQGSLYPIPDPQAAGIPPATVPLGEAPNMGNPAAVPAAPNALPLESESVPFVPAGN